jgi:hypothetical protein
VHPSHKGTEYKRKPKKKKKKKKKVKPLGPQKTGTYIDIGSRDGTGIDVF